MDLKQEELDKKIEFCLDFYRQSYGNFPNVSLISDDLIKIFYENKLLKSGGKETKEYSGLLLKTKKVLIKLYRLGRINKGDLENLSSGTYKKFRGHKSGGILPMIFITQKSFYRARKIISKKRFENPLLCDLGIPMNQLEQKLIRQIKENR